MHGSAVFVRHYNVNTNIQNTLTPTNWLSGSVWVVYKSHTHLHVSEEQIQSPCPFRALISVTETSFLVHDTLHCYANACFTV